VKDRLFTAVLVGGFALLLFELRFEHREALGETGRAWIPIAYCGVSLLAGLIAVLRWTAAWRRALLLLFGAGIAIGLAGFLFHTGGHPVQAVSQALAIWRVPPGKNGGIKPGSQPPALAPLAFCGLGTLGLLACWKPNR
jgi:hypothetical protein